MLLLLLVGAATAAAPAQPDPEPIRARHIEHSRAASKENRP